MAVTVTKYGVHYKWARDLPEQVTSQVRLGHDLRNDLVRVELDRREAMEALWSSYPQVAQAEQARDAAEERAQAAEEAFAQAKVSQRTRSPKGPAVQERKDARAAVKEARSARREAIAQVRAEAREQIVAINDAARAAQKDLYTQYVAKGLYWATFNAVLDAHKTAVKRIDASRAQGRPAQMRFKRWDGTGRVAVQLQRGKDQPQRTPAHLADAQSSKWRNVLHLPWVDPEEWEAMSRAEQRQVGRVTARMRMGSALDEQGTVTPAWAEVPLQVHRMLPADADVTGAELVLSRVGSKIKAHLCVTAKIPDPTPATGPAVALHLGWRRDADQGRAIVGTWAATAPLDAHPDLRGILAPHPGGTSGHIVLPDRVADRITAHEKTRSTRDKDLEGIKATLVDWLEAHGPVGHPTRVTEDGEPEPLTATGVARWRSPARFASLAQAWREAPPKGGEDLATALEAWRAVDKKAWDASEHGRTKALRHRDDLYAQVAATVASQAGTVIVDDTNLADIARQSTTAEAMQTTGLPGQVLDAASARRTNTAPGVLREKVVAAATREGVEVVKVPAKGLSSTCTACGHQAAPEGHQATCPACGHTRDVDLAAATLLLRRHVEGTDAA